MRQTAIPLAAVLLGAVCWGQTELEVVTPFPGAPQESHWYQNVSPGVHLSHLAPVEYFRGLLGMSPAERERVLAGKVPEERKAILDKVREYEALPRAVREARLHQTELHWHLLNLMREEKADRAAELDQISPLDQPMVLEPLAQWDELPAATRKALLEKEDFIRIYLDWAAHSPAGKKDMLEKLPAAGRVRWQAEWQRWQQLPEEQRAALCGQFRQFFTLTIREQQQTIDQFSDGDRRDMEDALRLFDRLPPAERQACVNAFGKFAKLTAEERNQFLRNAQRWEAMSAYERQTWRELVEQLPPMPPAPPMPPGFPAFPPFPPTTTAQATPAGAAR
jgi:hypothetical protein